MNKYVFLMLYLSACWNTEPGEIPVVTQENVIKPEVVFMQETPNACLYAWGEVSAAWREKLDSSPACQHLDTTIDIVVASSDETPCPGLLREG